MNDYKDVILHGDSLDELRKLPEGFVNTCVTSPPYWGLRDYGVEGQLGAESSPDEYVQRVVEIFREVWRVLRDDGTLWLNLGDSFATRKCGNLKTKDLVGIPWRVAFALQNDGWYLRSDIIWNKTNVMPESVRDRPTKAHEYIFLLSKKSKYYYDVDRIREPQVCKTENESRKRASNFGSGYDKWEDAQGYRGNGGLGKNSKFNPKGRNKRTVWNVANRPFKGAHFAVFPPDLIEPCVLAGTPAGGIVLDPFFGAGTTGLVANKHGRHYVGVELNREYIDIAESRLAEN
jgi:DNA modification methylase